MLFDLRSRGRRRTVQVVYLGLAVLMGGGLVLFGVGAGNGAGGLLNGIAGTGSGGGSQVVNQQETAALKAIKQNPHDAQAWGNLLQARWATAINGNDYSATTGFTAAGRQELIRATEAWQRYAQLTTSPDPNLATLAARAYTASGKYSGAAGAWDAETASSPGEAKGYECLAVNAYAAGQTRKADLAAGKALKLVPKAQQSTTKLTLNQAKNSSATARNFALQC